MEISPNTIVASMEVCRACKTEVRPGSAFCYHCGGGLGQPVEPAPISDVLAPSENGTLKNGPGVKTEQNRQQNRRERRPRLRTTEPIQVVWKRDEGIGARFILLTIFAAVFTMLLIGVAWYLK